MSPHAATFDDALRWLDLFAGWDSRSVWWPMERWRPEHHGMTFYECGRSEGLIRLVRGLDQKWSSQVLLGVPTGRYGEREAQTATVLWTVTDSPRSVAALERFKPRPSLVLRIGQQRVALWPLVHPLKFSGIVRGNRRIAHRFGTPKKWAEPERMWIPAPGTFVRRGRQRPAAVVVERMELDTFEPLQVIGKLSDAPAPDAWRNKAA